MCHLTNIHPSMLDNKFIQSVDVLSVGVDIWHQCYGAFGPGINLICYDACKSVCFGCYAPVVVSPRISIHHIDHAGVVVSDINAKESNPSHIICLFKGLGLWCDLNGLGLVVGLTRNSS